MAIKRVLFINTKTRPKLIIYKGQLSIRAMIEIFQVLTESILILRVNPHQIRVWFLVH